MEKINLQCDNLSTHITNTFNDKLKIFERKMINGNSINFDIELGNGKCICISQKGKAIFTDSKKNKKKSKSKRFLTISSEVKKVFSRFIHNTATEFIFSYGYLMKRLNESILLVKDLKGHIPKNKYNIVKKFGKLSLNDKTFKLILEECSCIKDEMFFINLKKKLSIEKQLSSFKEHSLYNFVILPSIEDYNHPFMLSYLDLIESTHRNEQNHINYKYFDKDRSMVYIFEPEIFSTLQASLNLQLSLIKKAGYKYTEQFREYLNLNEGMIKDMVHKLSFFICSILIESSLISILYYNGEKSETLNYKLLLNVLKNISSKCIRDYPSFMEEIRVQLISFQ